MLSSSLNFYYLKTSEHLLTVDVTARRAHTQTHTYTYTHAYINTYIPSQVEFEIVLSANVTDTFIVEVTPKWAPRGADRFRQLVENGYYNGCRFFRVLPGFMAQWGIS
jgi:hypothetical protein